MVVNIYTYPREMQTNNIAYSEFKGYLELDEFDPERCFDLCNQARQDTKPDNLFADIKFCGSGVCFENTETNEYWLALSVGWKHGTKEEIEECVKKNTSKLVWTED